MDDALVVGDFEGLGDLPRDGQRVIERQARVLRVRTRRLRELVRERLALDEFENQEANAVRFLEAVDRADVGMIQRREHPRLALEACEPIRVARERTGQDLDRDVAPELRVVRRYTSPMPPAPSSARS